MADSNTAKAMSKTQIAAHLAERFGIPKRQALEILDEVSALAYAETNRAGEFTLPGLGKLVRQERPSRTGRNPATGEAIEIAAATVVKFRLAKAAKDAILPDGDGS